jgi:beta-lactamase class A
MDRGDDRRQRGLDRLHRDEIQPEIERVLADAEDQHRPPLPARQAKGLAQRQRDADPERPDRKNRSDSAVSGGAASTMMRADVKADDQIRAKTSPRSARENPLPS